MFARIYFQTTCRFFSLEITAGFTSLSLLSWPVFTPVIELFLLDGEELIFGMLANILVNNLRIDSNIFASVQPRYLLEAADKLG